ncbi:MAG: hypothetical protein DHS20C21_23800 [Gemmatimonadota bacterium]|nr:MAG: hypothetical protein DHS20C21_23800 [Gemmatimonadota bacterium]
MEYARFNALKTVSDARESTFSVENVGPLTVTQDRSREPSYYNRIVGCTGDALPWLDRALEHLGDGTSTLRIDVDMQELDAVAPALRERGFAPGQELIWLASRTGRRPCAAPVLKLGPDDADRILPLLELEGPIASELWALRRGHHCTERFRVFVVEVDDQVVAMATTFVGARGAVLGNAFTREEWRGRGFQAALLSARLADADESHLEWVVTDVEPATASLRNCERAGFVAELQLSLWER